MLAAVKTENSKEILLENKPIPELEEDELLIKVEACGICGSDLHAFVHSRGYEFVDKPIILGHEIAGEVVGSGEGLQDPFIGKRVIVESMHYCGRCENCNSDRFSICENNKVIGLHFNGGMAEYVKTKRKYVKEIPDGLLATLASLSEPMAVAVHAVEKAGEIKENQRILVQGPGIIGFFIGLVCLAKGARVILSGLEKDYPIRLSKAEEFGMIPHRTNVDVLPEKVDLLFECSGSPAAVIEGFKQLKKGGKAVFVALYEQTVELFLTDLVRNEWPIITSYGCNPSDYEIAFEVLERNQHELQKIISYYPLGQINEAFKDSLSQSVMKAVLEI